MPRRFLGLSEMPSCSKVFESEFEEHRTVVGDVVRGLEARFPWLSSWFGDRLDIELPAFLVSLTIHGLLLVSLAFAGYQRAQRSPARVQQHGR